MKTRRTVRPPAVAGRFYPADPTELEATVRESLSRAPAPSRAPPRALVAPHAGYDFSGPIAGSAYRLVQGAPGIERVVLAGPSHYVAFEGLALPESDAFATPLGEHAVDPTGSADLVECPGVRRWALAHRDEHCLEVQLPFVHVALGPVAVVPIVTGAADPEAVADVLERIWTPRTLLVVSSDLSHYLPYERAREVDARTAAAVEQSSIEDLGPERACGSVALRGLLVAAKRRKLEARCVDLRNSGDTAGPRGRVVGYGAFGFWAVVTA